MKKDKACGIVVYRKLGKKVEFLLLKSKKYGDWGLGKGHAKGDETERETATREVFEESGLKVEIMDGFRVSISYLIDSDVMKEAVYFVGGWSKGKVRKQKSEISDFEWLTLSAALERLTFDSLKEVVLQANEFINNQDLKSDR